MLAASRSAGYRSPASCSATSTSGHRARRRGDPVHRAPAHGMIRGDDARKSQTQIGSAPVADPKAKEFLRSADPLIARLIDAIPISAHGHGATSCRRSTRSARSSFRCLASSFQSPRPVRSYPGSWSASGTAALTGGAPRRGSTSASRQRHVGSHGRDATGDRRTVRRRAPQRCGASRDERRRGRGGADRGAGSRAMDGTRISAHRARSARRVPPWRSRAPARDRAGV
jgi:hypothetical protein